MLREMPLQIPWKGKNIPHGVIEVNQKCNLKCDSCYKNKINYEKSLDQIKEEIDLMDSIRNLASMTLTGGEPTLHEDLPEIISYIQTKGIRPMLLTNGTMLDNKSLKKYKVAGLARIGIHIDKHQKNRPDSKNVKNEKDLNPLRKKYLDLCEKNNIGTSLQLTLYKDSLKELFDVIDFSRERSSNLAGLFFTLYSPDVDMKDEKSKNKNNAITNKDIIRLMRNKENAYPVMYISSNLNENSLRWIFYTSFTTIDKNGNIYNLYLDPKHKNLLLFFIELQRKIKGRYSFDDPRKNFQNYTSLLLYGLLSLSPKTFYKCFKLLIRGLINNNLKVFNILFQEGPKYLGDGEYEICKNCPDMTVRNNKLVPVCLADFIDPIKKK